MTSWVLIAIYVPFAHHRDPVTTTARMESREVCQAKGRAWSGRIVSGRAWFFCTKRGAK